MAPPEGLRVRVLGCGDAFGSGGRFQSAFLIETADMCCLIDCGATTMVAFQRAGIDPAVVDAVLISHLHGDHFGGLPFLILDQQFRSRRTRPLVVVGPDGIEDRLRALMRASYPGTEHLNQGFDLDLRAFVPDGVARPLGAATVAALEVDHPSGAASLGLRVEASGRTLAYSGDTQWTERLETLADGADLIICECFAYAPGIAHHMDYLTLTEKRSRLRAHRIALTHLGPEMLTRRDQVDMEVLDDGTVIAL